MEGRGKQRQGKPNGQPSHDNTTHGRGQGSDGGCGTHEDVLLARMEHAKIGACDGWHQHGGTSYCSFASFPRCRCGRWVPHHMVHGRKRPFLHATSSCYKPKQEKEERELCPLVWFWPRAYSRAPPFSSLVRMLLVCKKVCYQTLREALFNPPWFKDNGIGSTVAKALFEARATQDVPPMFIPTSRCHGSMPLSHLY